MKYIKHIFSVLTLSTLLFTLSSQAGVISPYKWGDSAQGTPGGEVTWSLMDTGISCAGTFEPAGCTTTSLFDFMPTGFLAEIDRAFNAWSAVADITFKMVTDGGEVFGGTPSADIRIAGHVFDGPSKTLAHAYYPVGSAAGDLHFDIAENWGIGSGFDIFSVALHEIGHSIGIDHSDDPNAVMRTTYGLFPELTQDDILTVQSIYGPAQIQASVPEPSSVVIFMSMIGLMLVNKRKKQ